MNDSGGASDANAAAFRKRATPVFIELVAGGQTGLDRLFAQNGLPLPTVFRQPTAGDLRFRPLVALFEYWSALTADDSLPHFAAIDPLDFKPALGWVVLVEAAADGWDYRYRLYGSSIAQFNGYDLTGRWLSAFESVIPVGGFAPIFYLATYRYCWHQRRPLATIHQPDQKVTQFRWHRAVLPLAGDDGTVARLLVGMVPSDPKVGFD